MKRMALPISLIVLLVCLGMAVPHYVARYRLKERKIALEGLEQQAKESQERSIAILRSGQYDMHVEIGTPLIEKAIQQLVGYEQITTKGNRFVIRSLEPEFGQGTIFLNAAGDFKWRFGFYNGLVEVEYHGYTKLDAQGECYIHLRVFDARPVETWSFFNGWLAPILTLRLQDKLKIPDIRLPLNYSDRFEVPKIRKEFPERQMRITIPERDISLVVQRPLLYTTQDGLGLVIEKIGGWDRGAGELTEPALGGEETTQAQKTAGTQKKADVVFSMSHAFLAQILTRLTTPAEDVLIYIEEIPNVWEKKGEIFGKPYHYTADISYFSGYIDIYDTQLQLASSGLDLEFGLQGVLHGTLESSIAGIRVPIPFKVLPALHDSIPVFLDAETMELKFQDKTMEIDLQIETDIRSWALKYNYPLSFDIGTYFRPVKIPAAFEASLSIPTFVAKRKIKRIKKIPLTVDWDMVFPDDSTGVYTFYGLVEPDLGRAEELEAAK